MAYATRYVSPQLRALYVFAAVIVALCHLAYDLGVRASVHRPALVAFITRYARIAALFAIGFVRGLITPEAAEQPEPLDAYGLPPVRPAFVPTLSAADFVIPADDTATPVPFTLKALRAECIRYGLPTYGTKAQLLARIVAPF